MALSPTTAPSPVRQRRCPPRVEGDCRDNLYSGYRRCNQPEGPMEGIGHLGLTRSMRYIYFTYYPSSFLKASKFCAWYT